MVKKKFYMFDVSNYVSPITKKKKRFREKISSEKKIKTVREIVATKRSQQKRTGKGPTSNGN